MSDVDKISLPDEGKNLASKVKDGKIFTNFWVEVGDDRGRRIVWPLDRQSLRGRWSTKHAPSGGVTQSMADMPDIPGIYIGINFKEKAIAFIDPLNDMSNKELLNKINRTHKRVFFTNGSPEKDRIRRLDDDSFKTAVYQIRRMLDNSQCEVKKGEVPSMKELFTHLSGKIKTKNFDEFHGAEHYDPDPEVRLKNYVPLSELNGDKNDEKLTDSFLKW